MADENQEFIKSYRENQLKFARFYTNILSRADLNLAQYALLVQLLDVQKTTMTELSVKLHISKPAITNLVDRLEKKKFLKRLSHPTDRRINLVEIQPEGKKIVSRMQTQVLNILLKTLNSFNLEDRKTISRFYRNLAQVMDSVLLEGRKKK